MDSDKRPVWYAAAGIFCCQECGHVFAQTGARRLGGDRMHYPKGVDISRCPVCHQQRALEGSNLLLGIEDLPRRLHVCRSRAKRYGWDATSWPGGPDRDTGRWRRLNDAIPVDWRERRCGTVTPHSSGEANEHC